MFIPLRTDSPLRRTPYVNWLLIALNVVGFALQMAYKQKADRFTLDPGEPSVLTFFTSMFMHGDIWHITANMLFLYIFGNKVNDKLGHIPYLIFYLAGGVFAGFTYIWTSSPVAMEGAAAVYAPVLGASGAIAAVTGAFLVLYPQVRVHIFVLAIFSFFTIEVPGWALVAVFFVQDVVLQLLPGAGGNVAHSAHIGGSVFGFVVIFTLVAVGLIPRSPTDALAAVKRWNRRREYRDAIATGWNPYGFGGSPPNAKDAAIAKPDSAQQRVMELRAEISESIAHGKHDQAAELYLQLKQLSPGQVLSRQAQLDVANELALQERYPQAAEAYERLLAEYPKHDQLAAVTLILGVILRRELAQPQRAAQWLAVAAEALPPGNQRNTALEHLELAKGDILAGGVGSASKQ